MTSGEKRNLLLELRKRAGQLGDPGMVQLLNDAGDALAEAQALLEGRETYYLAMRRAQSGLVTAAVTREARLTVLEVEREKVRPALSLLLTLMRGGKVRNTTIAQFDWLEDWLKREGVKFEPHVTRLERRAVRGELAALDRAEKSQPWL